MLKEERYARILSILEADKKVTAALLSQTLQLSEATVRRDLTDLDALGKLRKVHGGAVPMTSPFSFQQRRKIQPEAKRKIAQKTLPLLKGRRTILIDAGTTNLALVEQFPADLSATCITNSPVIAQRLTQYTGIEVVVTGGRYEIHHEALLGPWTIRALQSVYADVCILGVCSLHPRYGLTTDDVEQATVKQTMIRQAREVIALVSQDKLNTVETHRVGAVGEVTTLVADLSPGDPRWDRYREQPITIL